MRFHLLHSVIRAISQAARVFRVGPEFLQPAIWTVYESTADVAEIRTSTPTTISIFGGPDAALFAVTALTDRTAQLSFLSAPTHASPEDADVNNIYEIILKGVDANGNETVQTFKTTVLQQVPVIDPGQSWSINEDAAVASAVGTPTGNNVGGTFANWQIVGGDGAAFFAINASTGEITVADTLNVPPAGVSYSLSITVDVGALTSNPTTVVVNVADVAADAPTVNAGQSFSIPENATVGAVVGQLLADPGTAAITGWSITAGNTGTAFAVSSGGQITVANTLDYETLASYTLTVTATNSVGTSAGASVGVTVTDVSEATGAPTITSNGGGSTASVQVNEGVISVTTVTAEDSRLAPITYSITGGAQSASFTINEATGALAFASTPTAGTYVVEVTASDGAESDPQTITVVVSSATDIGIGSWTPSNMTMIAGTGGILNGPVGTVCTENTNAATQYHFASKTVSLSADTYFIIMRVARLNRSLIINPAGGPNSVYFNLQALTVTGASGGGMRANSDGTVTCWATRTHAGGDLTIYMNVMTDAGVDQYAGTGTPGLVMYQALAEVKGANTEPVEG